jgi:transposase-like protein
MNKFTEKAVVGLSESGLGLDELVRHGARQVIQQAIEAELSALLERFENVKTLHGQRAVRNGYLPEREVLTAAGAIPVKVPKVRDRSATTHTPDLTVSPSNSQLHFSPHYLVRLAEVREAPPGLAIQFVVG